MSTEKTSEYFDETMLDDEEFDVDHGENEASDSLGFEEEDFAALGIDPFKPTRARPGSEAKMLTIAARYAAGLALWHPDDELSHGPRETDLGGGEAPSRDPKARGHSIGAHHKGARN